MKRMSPDPTHLTKKLKLELLPSSLPVEVWHKVISELDLSSINSIVSTSKFFSTNNSIKLLFYKNTIKKFFDYRDESELANFTSSFTINVINQFNEIYGYRQAIELFFSTIKEIEAELNSNTYTEIKFLDSLFFAVKQGHIGALNLLINYSSYDITHLINRVDENGINVLGYAAMHERKGSFFLLLKAGAALMTGPIIPYDATHLVMFDISYCSHQPVTPLHIIALKSHESWLYDIFEQFSNLLETVCTASYKQHLQFILANDHIQLATLLQSDNSVLQETDIINWNLLHWAACLGKSECIEVLIQNGMDINSQAGYGGMSPFHLACASGKLQAMQTLISFNAVIDEVDMEQNTCLHLTAYHGYYECTVYLIEKLKLDVNAENSEGDTPLKLAQLKITTHDIPLSPMQMAQKLKCVEVLNAHGATEIQLPQENLALI